MGGSSELRSTARSLSVCYRWHLEDAAFEAFESEFSGFGDCHDGHDPGLHRVGYDEIGHVGYCAARCSRSERRLMRWLYPYFGRLVARQTAEISLLTDREKLRARLGRPFDVNELTIGMAGETFLAAHP